MYKFADRAFHSCRSTLIYTICTCILLSIATISIAGINKCIDSNGNVTYTEKACPKNDSAATLDITTGEPSNSTNHDAVNNQLYLQRLRNELIRDSEARIRREKLNSRHDTINNTYDRKINKIHSDACNRARRGMEKYSVKRRRGGDKREMDHYREMMSIHQQQKDKYCK